MGCLITMATHDTAENKRSEMTYRTLESLERTVDFSRHRLIVVDNGSIEETHAIYQLFANRFRFEVIYNGTNLGTARALNRAWQHRKPGWHILKLDNDAVIEEPGWLDRLEECVEREPRLGLLGLKRKDLDERPDHEAEHYRSELVMLPHEKGQRWLVVERVLHTIGTCLLHSSRLLDRVGYLFQPTLYGLDDSAMAARCYAAGFFAAFYPHYTIHHIDPGGDDYCQWKREEADAKWPVVGLLGRGFKLGLIDPYYGGEGTKFKLTDAGRELLARGEFPADAMEFCE